jgi:hypothetical protein
VASNFSRNNGGIATLAMHLLRPFFISPAKAAETPVFLATAPGLAGVTGRYFYQKRQHQSARRAHDRDDADWLWRTSETLTGFTYPKR